MSPGTTSLANSLERLVLCLCPWQRCLPERPRRCLVRHYRLIGSNNLSGVCAGISGVNWVFLGATTTDSLDQPAQCLWLAGLCKILLGGTSSMDTLEQNRGRWRRRLRCGTRCRWARRPYLIHSNIPSGALQRADLRCVTPISHNRISAFAGLRGDVAERVAIEGVLPATRPQVPSSVAPSRRTTSQAYATTSSDSPF